MKKILRQIPGYRSGKKIFYLANRIKRRLKNSLNPTARILLYHRIAEIKNDPHRLAVSPDNFREQLKYLSANYRIVPLNQLVEERQSKKIKNGTVVITFDDGYADNWQKALPVLKEFNIPATFFIATETIGQNLFYWDQDNPDAGRPLNSDELRQLAAETALVEIGSHTLTHPRLSKLSPEEQAKEIFKSKELLEAVINKPVLSFAYPFGDQDSFNQDTMSLVKKAGYRYACANIHERVRNNSDIFALPRYVIRNWNLEEFKKELENFI